MDQDNLGGLLLSGNLLLLSTFTLSCRVLVDEIRMDRPSNPELRPISSEQFFKITGCRFSLKHLPMA